MTREEALSIMQVIVHMLEKQYDNDRVEEAVEIAIEALKAQPCVDVVSREAVKELYCMICMETNICYQSKENCKDLKLFDRLPSVQPERAKGEWVKLKVGYGCPFCSLATNQRGIELYRFCPNCGADMRGGE